MAKTFTPSFYHKSVILQRRRSKCGNQTLSTPLRASVRRFAAFCARRRCRRRRKGKPSQNRAGASVRALARSRIMRACDSGLCSGWDARGFAAVLFGWVNGRKESERVPPMRHSFVSVFGLSCGAHFVRRAPFCSAPVIRGIGVGRTPLGTLPARTPCRAGSCNSRRTARADPRPQALSSPRSCKP